MNRYFARHALLPEGWAENVRFEVDASGKFASVTPHSAPDGATLLDGLVLSGMPNVHSHAFQRAFAGRTERAGPRGDSFWTWREAMYEMLETIDPDEFEEIAADAYTTMLRGGYTSVVEFHYVHNARGGVPYARRTELADRIVNAARRTGIALTLVPVLYRYSDFREKAPAPRQKRFVLSLDAFADLWGDLYEAYHDDPQISLGVAPHSLRAVGTRDLPEIVALVDGIARGKNVPIHMHASEQTREVEACLAAHDTTPIELLMRHVRLSERWCLVHCTHATERERAAIQDAGAVTGLCPTTEASLGDGIFPAADFVRAGGRIAIGTDSNVSIDVSEELRWLEYVQRLSARERNLFHADGRPAVGRFLYETAVRGGTQVSGRDAGELAAGKCADLIAVRSPEGYAPDDRLGIALFRSGAWKIETTIVGGAIIAREDFAARRTSAIVLAAALFAGCASNADSTHAGGGIVSTSAADDAADLRTIGELKTNGSDVAKATDVRHYLFVPTADTAGSAAKALEALGYHTETAPPDDKSTAKYASYYEIRASISIVPSLEHIRTERLEFENLAAQYGGDYKGWEGANRPVTPVPKSR